MRVPPVSAALSTALSHRRGTATRQRATDPQGMAFIHPETGKVDFDAHLCPPGFVALDAFSPGDFEKVISLMIRNGSSTRDISRLRVRRKQLA